MNRSGRTGGVGSVARARAKSKVKDSICLIIC